jgi:hypothetical protein
MTEQTPNNIDQFMGKPLFFNRLMTLDREQHAHLKVDPNAGFAFAANTHLIPISIFEFRFVARHFPIIFSNDPIPMPLAVVGLQAGTNLVVDNEGKWRLRTYIPACVHTYPFILLPVRKGSDEVSVIIDPDAHNLGDTGEALFVEGKATPVLDRVVQLTSYFRAGMTKTIAFGKMLAEQDLLTRRGVELVLQDGTKFRIDNFLTLDQEKMEKVANNIFLHWRKDGWLLPMYQFLQSIDAWSPLADLESDRRAAAAKA